MGFSKSQMPEKSFQVTRRSRLIGLTFLKNKTAQKLLYGPQNLFQSEYVSKDTRICNWINTSTLQFSFKNQF